MRKPHENDNFFGLKYYGLSRHFILIQGSGDQHSYSLYGMT